MDTQKGYGSKDTSGTLFSANTPISVQAQKSISSYMDSGSVFPTKITFFAYANFYPPMSLNSPEPFGVGINSKAVTSFLSDEGSLLKVGSFLFGSPASASDVSKTIFDIKTTEYKTKISTPMFSGSVKKKSYPLFLWMQEPH